MGLGKLNTRYEDGKKIIEPLERALEKPRLEVNFMKKEKGNGV